MCFQYRSWLEARKWSDNDILSTIVYSDIQLQQPVAEPRNPGGELNVCKINDVYSYLPHWVLLNTGHGIEKIRWKLPSIMRTKQRQKFEDRAPMDVDTMPDTSYMELRSLI